MLVLAGLTGIGGGAAGAGFEGGDRFGPGASAAVTGAQEAGSTAGAGVGGGATAEGCAWARAVLAGSRRETLAQPNAIRPAVNPRQKSETPVRESMTESLPWNEAGA